MPSIPHLPDVPMLFFACTEDPQKDDSTVVDSRSDSPLDSPTDSPVDSPTDSENPDSILVENLTVEPGVISTVLLLSWQSSRPAIAWIEWEESSELLSYVHKTRSEKTASLDHTFVLAGLPPSTTGSWRIAQQDETGIFYSDPQSFSTGDFPAELPALNVIDRGSTSTAEGLNGYFLFSIENNPFIVLYNRDGLPCWWTPPQETGFHARARYIDGWIWYNRYSKMPADNGYVIANNENGMESETFISKGMHHDFWVDKEGMATIVQDPRLGPDGEVWTGDSLVWKPWGGSEEVLWTSWDHVTQSGGTGENFFPGTTDWMHCNGLHRDGDLFAMSCKGQDAVYGIGLDQSTPWTFSGQDATLATPDATLDLIHGPYLREDSLWIFSNGVLEGRQGPEILSYTLDFANNEARIIARYQIPNISALHFGNAIPLPDGRAMVSFGWGNQLIELDATMNALSQYQTPFYATYFDYVPEFGGPVEPPWF